MPQEHDMTGSNELDSPDVLVQAELVDEKRRGYRLNHEELKTSHETALKLADDLGLLKPSGEPQVQAA